MCGAVVMVYEIVGSRVVAPYIGTSTYVWTSLIGVILAALSLGYWLGGRIADKRPDPKVLAAVVFLAGGAVSLTILIKDIVLSAVGTSPVGLEIRSVAAASVLFAPAAVLLGFVTPYAVKLKTTTLDDSGKTVGRLYALSTVGSIAGTFAAGFFLIPFVGSTRTLYIIAGLLFVVSLLLAPLRRSRAAISALVLFVFGIGTNEFAAWYQRSATGMIDVDTEYSRVRIFNSVDPRTGRPMRSLATDPFFSQSAIYLDDGSPAFEYIRFFHLAARLNGHHKNALMIGGAGYAFPREYLSRYPQASMDVVEIDPGMTALAREHFFLTNDPRLRIFHEDGRVFLDQAESASYDAVFVDAFGSLFSVPYHLTTLEAVLQIRRLLRDDGVVLVNIGSAIDGPAALFLNAEYVTYSSVFRDVVVFKVRPERSDTDLQNVVLAACVSTCRFDDKAQDLATEQLVSQRIDSFRPAAGTVPLTDDLAPVEYFNSVALSVYR